MTDEPALYIVLAERIEALEDKVASLTATLRELVDEKINDYAGVLQRAEAALTKNFHPDRYPDDPREMHDWYHVTFTYLPHIAASPFATGVAGKIGYVAERIEAETTARMAGLKDAAISNVADSIKKALSSVITTATKLLNEERTSVRAETFANVEEAFSTAIDNLPDCYQKHSLCGMLKRFKEAVYTSADGTGEYVSSDDLRYNTMLATQVKSTAELLAKEADCLVVGDTKEDMLSAFLETL
jgi:phosphoglycolate phosphatase-like HAD superfamily hydrolase